MQLQPQEYFTIVRQIGDPSDSNTYFVRAVIRNARTDVLIDTINLTDRGSRRFSLPWQVPADPSGQGFYISVLTSVYMDSGYTTKSDIYSEEMETYLVDNRFRNLGGGGGDDVSYSKIRKIFEDVLKEFFFTKEGVFKFFQDLSPISKAFSLLGLSKLSDWMEKTTNKLNIISVKADVIRENVSEINMPEFEKTDLQPILTAISKIEIPKEVNIKDLTASLKDLFSGDIQEIKKLTDSFPDLTEKANMIEIQMKDFLYILEKKTEIKPESKPIISPPDYTTSARGLLKIS